MATVEEAARDGARARVSANRARKAAVAARRVEAVLDRRSRGWKVERIAHDLRIEVPDVRRVIEAARTAGDGRALTDKRAAALAATPAERDATLDRMGGAIQALASFVEAQGPDAQAPRSRGLCSDIGRASRAAYVARLRELAAGYTTLAPAAASGLAHLADLHEHCDRHYPSYLIASDGATIESTNRAFPPASVVAMSSPAQLCVEG